MKNILSIIISVLTSLGAVSQISYLNWDYPEDIQDENWYIIYDLLPDYQLKTCLDIRNIEALDNILNDFQNTCMSRGAYGLPGEYRLPADDQIAVLLEALTDISGVQNVRGAFRPDFTVAFNGYGISRLVEWYNKFKTQINLDTFSLYVAAKMYLAAKQSPFNFLELNFMPASCPHYNHPLNDLDVETEQKIWRMDWDSIFEDKNEPMREEIDRILAKHPQNPFIKRHIQRAKVEQFCRMYKSGSSFKN